MNKSFFENNRKRLMNTVEDNSMVVLFSGKAPKKSADECYPFTTNRNFYYMTGIKEQEVMVILSKCNEEEKTILFIKEADPVMAKWVGKTIDKEEACETSGIQDIRYVTSFESCVHMYMGRLEVSNVYFDLERDSFEQDRTKSQRFAAGCRDKYPHVLIKNVFPLIEKLRMIKSEEEISEMRKAIEITNEGIKALMKHAKSGMMEYALEAYFDFELKTRGVKDYAFKTIAASEKNATVLHYEQNNCEIPKDSLILFDLGAQYNYYNADISRTIPADGKFTERQKSFYNIVLKAQLAVIEAIKPGVPFASLNEIVKDIYFEELSKLGMVKEKDEISKYYYHGVSHYLGLDTHDVGRTKGALEEGMVLTVEPGIYIEQECIGIRIEDDVVVTKEGCEVLSKNIIKTVEEIETFMNKK